MAKDLKARTGRRYILLARCLLIACASQKKKGQPPQVEATQEHNQLLQPGKLLKQPLEA